jgi:hypothetical protein
MRKSMIGAIFGGALAAGFLTVGTPVAHAGPPCYYTGTGSPTQACADCIQANTRAGDMNPVRDCSAMPAAPASPADQCRYASQQSGIPCNPKCPC